MKLILLALTLLFSFPSLAQREGLIIGKSCNIFFERFGTGRPILIVGAPSRPYAGTETVAKKLSKRNQVIVYDPRGTGRTRLPRFDTVTVNRAHSVEDIESIREVLRLPKLTLMATPGGHGIAEDYARLYPAQVEGLIWLTGSTWVETTGKYVPRVDSLLAKEAPFTLSKPLPTRPSLQVAYVETDAFYQSVDQFIRKNRLDYVKVVPVKKSGSSSRTVKKRK